jgi:hypothetical protein
MRECRLLGVGGDHFLVQHVGKYDGGAALGAFRIVVRREPRRRLHEARQHRGFRQR